MRGGRCLSLSSVSYMVGQARLTRSGSEYFSSTKPTRNRTYKQRRMRFRLVVKASDCLCISCNGPGFDSSIRWHSGI